MYGCINPDGVHVYIAFQVEVLTTQNHLCLPMCASLEWHLGIIYS